MSTSSPRRGNWRARGATITSRSNSSSPTIALLSGTLAVIGVACGPSDPQPRAEPSSTTTTIASSSTTASLSPTSTPDDILCGTELPLFPTATIVDGSLVDTDGTPGSAAGADSARDEQVVRHWVGDGGITIELRWPAGPGPDVQSPIVVTQLVETAAPEPCHVVRVSGYGEESKLDDVFATFVDSLDGIDAKPAFVQEQIDEVTPAVAAEPGECDEPILTTLGEDGNPEMEAVQDLLGRYANDRTNGTGYEACFTIAGLRELESVIAVDGTPDIVRPSETVGFEAEALATYLDADPLHIVRESLRVIAVPTDAGDRLLFNGLSTAPDSNVGEEEAIAFIDEFLLLVADRDYDSASGYLFNEGAGDDVLAAMPTFIDEPSEALRRYCRTALCDVSYKINDSIDFDATTRTIDVTFFGENDTIEWPMIVSAFEGQLVLLTAPPADA